jgi:hypothetical protein
VIRLDEPIRARREVAPPHLARLRRSHHDDRHPAPPHLLDELEPVSVGELGPGHQDVGRVSREHAGRRLEIGDRTLHRDTVDLAQRLDDGASLLGAAIDN